VVVAGLDLGDLEAVGRPFHGPGVVLKDVAVEVTHGEAKIR
jgi:hypothetical protein